MRGTISSRALRHRNYRLFFGCQSTSLAGAWITRIATSWLVDRLTRSVRGRARRSMDAFAILAFAGIINVTEIIILQVVQGVINSFDTPARGAQLLDV